MSDLKYDRLFLTDSSNLNVFSTMKWTFHKDTFSTMQLSTIKVSQKFNEKSFNTLPFKCHDLVKLS